MEHKIGQETGWYTKLKDIVLVIIVFICIAIILSVCTMICKAHQKIQQITEQMNFPVDI